MSITFLDGAIGSILMEEGEGSVAALNITEADCVLTLHERYVAAGCDIICANTFSVNEASKLEYPAAELIGKGISLAKQAACGKAKVAFDIGPLSVLLDPYGELSEEDCARQYREIIAAGAKQQPDYLFFETFMDVNMLEIAVKEAVPFGIPIICSMSFGEVGKTMMGQSVQDIVETLSSYPLVAIGLNCSLEPEVSLPIAKEFRKYTSLPIIFKPNAGLPKFDEQGICYEDARLYAEAFADVDTLGDVWIGGCCGSSPEHLKYLVAKFRQ